MTPKEKAQELYDKFNLPTGLMSIERKECAIISLENEYHSLREQLFNFKACGILINEKVYLFRLSELIEQEKQVRQELEKM